MDCLLRSPTIVKAAARTLGVLCCAALSAACTRDAAMPPATNGLSAAPESTSSGYSSLYSFGQHGKANDGGVPIANLVDLHGSLYGTTEDGGTTSSRCALGCGTVFRISPDGNENVIYRFSGADGSNPAAGLIAFQGSFYGTTIAGGASNACGGGCGTIFKLSRNGKAETVLHSFTGGSDGAEPAAGLVRMAGAFYGTTQFGGTMKHLCTSGCGTVFKVRTSGDESVVYRFKGQADGAYPTAALYARQGNLFGTTEYGGAVTRFCATGCGTLFKIDGTGVKKTLHDFKYGSTDDGAYPAASLVSIGNELYGTTSGGGKYGDGAVVTANSSSGTDRLLHSFRCCRIVTDGSYPVAALTVVNGELYGTTLEGGNGNHGTVFVVTTAGVESLLYQFVSRPDGQAPQASLTLLDGRLYGTTANGGSASLGTVFKIAP